MSYEVALRVRGAVLLPFRAVGRNPFHSANQAVLRIAQGTFEAITQNVKSGSVLVCSDGIGHLGLRWL